MSASPFEGGAELQMVLDDPVVDDSDPVNSVRVCVGFAWTSMGRPAGMADPPAPLNGSALERLQ